MSQADIAQLAMAIMGASIAIVIAGIAKLGKTADLE